MWPFLGSLIGAGASLFGGMMGQSTQSDMYWNNVKRSNRMLKYNKKLDLRNFNTMQKWNQIANQWTKRAFARSSLSYKIKEANKLGIHPLYALGANTGGFSSPSFSVGSGGVSDGGSAGYAGDGGMASGIAQAGQHLGRAVDAMATQEQRNEARIMSALNVENAGLQNELLRSQIRRMDAQTAPAIPAAGKTYMIDGQGNTQAVTNLDAVTFAQRYPDAKQNIQLGGVNQANPYVSNASDIEERYGELADMLWGGISIPADIYWNYIRNKGDFDAMSKMFGGGEGNPIGP